MRRPPPHLRLGRRLFVFADSTAASRAAIFGAEMATPSDWKRRGREAEAAAARLLRDAGFEILARNVRTAAGEIDILAREGPVLVVVEVKRRPTLSEGFRAVGVAKRRRMAKTARQARVKLGLKRGVPVRFDVVVATEDGSLSHRRGAFDATITFLA